MSSFSLFVLGFGDDPQPYAQACLVGREDPGAVVDSPVIQPAVFGETQPQSPRAWRDRNSAGVWPLSSMADSAPGVAKTRPNGRATGVDSEVFMWVPYGEG